MFHLHLIDCNKSMQVEHVWIPKDHAGEKIHRRDDKNASNETAEENRDSGPVACLGPRSGVRRVREMKIDFSAHSAISAVPYYSSGTEWLAIA
jgi:hypothetical protein